MLRKMNRVAPVRTGFILIVAVGRETRVESGSPMWYLTSCEDTKDTKVKGITRSCILMYSDKK